VLYNGGIILGTLALSAILGIYAAALGAILGALLHLAVRLWGLRGTGFRPWPRFSFGTGEVRDFVRLMLPKVVSQPLEIVTGGYFARVASTIAVGTVTAISIARDFSAVPATFIGGSFALAAFPSMSTAYAAGDRRGFLRIVGSNLATIGILSVLAAGTLALLGGLVVKRVLGGGAFDDAAVARTTEALAAFALAVPFESLSHLFSRALYATRNTVLQVLASLAGFGVTVIVSSALASDLGLVAIPLGFAAGSATKLLLLVAALAARFRRFPSPEAA
jgi:putative peptidoglycan lipid II flippase